MEDLRPHKRVEYYFDYNQFKNDIHHVVRAMDNIIDRAIYPLAEQEKEAKDKRRMGLGLTGVANAIEALGYKYGSEEFLYELQDIMELLRDEAYKTSIELAKEKGPFPLFNADLLSSGFGLTLPYSIQQDIGKYGLRNSHLLSIAPTGTISMTADNVSSGIEPVFSYAFDRDVQTADGPIRVHMEDYGYKMFGISGRTTDSVPVLDHVAVLNLASRYVDSACSKTCNVGDNVTWEEFKDVYMQAYKGGASGCTTFRASGKRYGILNASAVEDIVEERTEKEKFINEESGGACFFDPSTGLRTCA